MAGMLFVHGGDEFARTVYDREGRAYWSQALPLVLEKHGYLAVEEAGPEALEDADLLRSHDAVLVARLPDEAWTEAAVQTVAAGHAHVLAEGPQPRALEAALGVEAAGPVEEEGAIVVADPGLLDAARAFGVAPGGALAMPSPRPIEIDPSLAWTGSASVPITGEQAAGWARRGWDVARWSSAPQTHVLCEWVARGGRRDRFPAVVRRGSLVACSFGLFAFLGQRHSSEPHETPEWRTVSRSIGLEAVLLALVDDLHRRAGAVRARVLPWPAGKRWVRTVRHDVTRPLSSERLGELLRLHERAGSSATWFWPPSLAENGAPTRVLGAGRHEIALSAERLWLAPDSERARVERAAGRQVAGAGARASSSSFRFQGAPNVLWADRERLLYTELPSRAHLHPHRFAALSEDGLVRPLDVLCLPAHETLRYLLRDRDRLASAVRLWAQAGGLMQLAVDPERDGESAFDALGEMPSADRLDWTAAEALDWWRRTHVRDEMSLTALGDGRFRLAARSAVADVAVELLRPDGQRTVTAVDAGTEPVQVAAEVGARPKVLDWDVARQAFHDALVAYFAARGVDPESPARRASLHNNTVSIPGRGEHVLRMVRQLTDRDGIEGLRVLDVGSGLGALAAYLAWRGRPRRLTATDVNADLLDAGRRAAEELELSNLEFRVADMRDLSAVADESLDLVIANGVLMFLGSRRDLRRTVSEIARVLAPGGHLLVYQSNRWVWRDPRTGVALLHLLPPGLASHLERRRGRAGVRWISPLELRRRMRAGGFGDVRLVGFSPTERHDAGWRRYVDQRYAMVARRVQTGGRPGRRRRGSDSNAHRSDQLIDQHFPPTREWERIQAVYADHLQRYFADQGKPVESPQVQTTIRTNTSLVPQRGENLLRWLGSLAGVSSLADKRVLELGCGFGALASYLAWRCRPASLLAIDTSEAYLGVARACATDTALDEVLTFAKADMRSIDPAPTGGFDVLIANNSFIYLPSAAAADEALREFHRVLAPGGTVLFHHANKWRWHEPFTSDPLVHLLPPRLARVVSRVTGWRHNHGRVRLMSPPELRRRLRRAGFDEIDSLVLGQDAKSSGLRAHFGTFYTLAARRPAD